MYPTLTVRDNLRFFAGLAGLRGRELRDAHRRGRRPRSMLDGLIDRRASQLSGGERRRLHTAIALVHRPRLVLLDEPTTGADVQTRSEILALVRSARATTARRSCTRRTTCRRSRSCEPTVAFIDHGRIVARGELGELISALRLERARAHVHGCRARPRRASTVRSCDDSTVTIATDDPAVPRPRSARRGSDPTRRRCVRSRSCARASSRCSSPLTGRRYARSEPADDVAAPAGVHLVRRLGVIVGHELRLAAARPARRSWCSSCSRSSRSRSSSPRSGPRSSQSGYPHANGAEQVVPGQAAMAAFFIVALVTFAFFAEHGWATWDRLRASPATSFEIVVGKSAAARRHRHRAARRVPRRRCARVRAAHPRQRGRARAVDRRVLRCVSCCWACA